MQKTSDIKVLGVQANFATIPRRVSFQFAKGAMVENLVASVNVVAANREGKQATGHGSVHLAAPWAYPDADVPKEAKLAAMQGTVCCLADLIADCSEYAHPLDLYWSHRQAVLDTARRMSQDMGLARPLPALAGYVCYAAIDMALLDAFGRANRVNVFGALGPEFCAHDLGHYLGPGFGGRYIEEYISPHPAAGVPFAHTVGANDPLTRADLDGSEPDDGLPTTLHDWIARDGVRFLKLKLDASDVSHAVARTVDVFRLADGRRPGLTADFNEACDHAEWVVEYLVKLRETSPAAFDALLYVEQPFGRDADVGPEQVARVQALKPLVADEAITDTESVRRVLDRGWAGIALKVAKVMSSSFLHVAVARAEGRFLTMQDLCNCGLAHLASTGLAARIPLVGGVECNGRQFVPEAFPGVRAQRPQAFRFAHGSCETACLDGIGLGF